MNRIRLGVNVDHVATLRNARGARHPDPLRAARAAAQAGADSITAHLREDRRHISDDDIRRLRGEIDLPLNLEMAATPEMLAIALAVRPAHACLVPERRGEVTTEGGLDVAGGRRQLAPTVKAMVDAGIKVALFIDPDPAQLDASLEIGAPAIELHTGAYCDATGRRQIDESRRLVAAAEHAEKLGLECHAGHGLTYDNVGLVAAIPEIVELNIGHFLVGEAIFSGLGEAIARMRTLMDESRRARTRELRA
ncbi:MAG: pyridoxine 5'-phosphate synthase [Rhodospirillaceae bacterium]|nr:pyridoxine 5'-phosphate synthase [Rhodospirillaceae bacterium]